MSALEDIAAERRRQVQTEVWTPKHDDSHQHGELAFAGACYALASTQYDPVAIMPVEGFIREAWPWDNRWWKPTVQRRDLVKAAALILAEIERLDRLSTSGALNTEH